MRYRNIAVASAFIIFTYWLGGCAKSVFEQGQRSGEKPADVVATVAGQFITANDIQVRMRERKQSSRAALDDLVGEAILAAEAFHRDYEARPILERFAVQYLLKEIELEYSPASIDSEAVAKRFSELQEASVEKRKSMHVLVKGQDEHAQKTATDILNEFKAATDPRTVFEQYQLTTSRDGFAIRAEDLPAVPKGMKRWDEAFLTALFAPSTTGPVPQPVKSKFGWHAIVITEIIPAMTGTLRDYEAKIRTDLAQEARSNAVAELLKELKTRVEVTHNNEAWAQVAKLDLSTP